MNINTETNVTITQQVNFAFEDATSRIEKCLASYKRVTPPARIQLKYIDCVFSSFSNLGSFYISACLSIGFFCALAREYSLFFQSMKFSTTFAICYIGGIICIILLGIFAHYFRGKILIEPVWEWGEVSDNHLSFLSDNKALKSFLINRINDQKVIDYKWLGNVKCFNSIDNLSLKDHIENFYMNKKISEQADNLQRI